MSSECGRAFGGGDEDAAYGFSLFVVCLAGGAGDQSLLLLVGLGQGSAIKWNCPILAPWLARQMTSNECGECCAEGRAAPPLFRDKADQSD